MFGSKKLFEIISECSLIPFSFHYPFLYNPIAFLALASFRSKLNGMKRNIIAFLFLKFLQHFKGVFHILIIVNEVGDLLYLSQQFFHS